MKIFAIGVDPSNSATAYGAVAWVSYCPDSPGGVLGGYVVTRRGKGETSLASFVRQAGEVGGALARFYPQLEWPFATTRGMHFRVAVERTTRPPTLCKAEGFWLGVFSVTKGTNVVHNPTPYEWRKFVFGSAGIKSYAKDMAINHVTALGLPLPDTKGQAHGVAEAYCMALYAAHGAGLARP